MKIVIFCLAFFFSLSCNAQHPTSTEQQMLAVGLIRIQDVEPSIHEHLALCSSNNFTGRQLYTDLHAAYLHPQAALALKKAQETLQRLRPDLSLLVLDAARPMSVQGYLYAAVQGTGQNIYVNDPRAGGDQHNYGLAVDVTLCNVETGDTLSMGTAYGALIPASGQSAENGVEEGETSLAKEAIENRRLLRRVLAVGGFKPLRTQWWHFNFRTRSEAKANFTVIR